VMKNLKLSSTANNGKSAVKDWKLLSQLLHGLFGNLSEPLFLKILNYPRQSISGA